METIEKIPIRMAQCDISGHLTLGELFLMSQDIAGVDSDKLGYGPAFMEKEGIIWVLSRMSAVIYNPARSDTPVVLSTWHGDPVRYVFPRYYRLQSETGEILCEVSSVWMLVDRQTHSLIMPSARGYTMPPQREDMPHYPLPGKIRFDFPLDQSVRRIPVYSDFDVNGHMNNARYPIWICDLFPPSRYRERYISSIQINYVQEILQGEEVLLSFGEKGDAFAVRGTVGENVKFEAMGEFALLPDME